MKKSFGSIQDNPLEYPYCLHYTSLHYSTLQRSAQSRVKHISLMQSMGYQEKTSSVKGVLPVSCLEQQWESWPGIFTKVKPKCFYKNSKVITRPHLNTFRGLWGLSKGDTKLTVVMWCQKFDYKTAAPSSGRLRGGDLLTSYLSTFLGLAAARPGGRQAHPAAEHLTNFIR